MDVNRDNYEAFVLDYLEGSLPKSDHQKMVRFLTQNPDIEEEICDLLDYTVRKQEIVYPQKKLLVKSTGKTYNLWQKGIAAVIGLFVLAGIYVFISQRKTTNSQEFVEEPTFKHTIPQSPDDVNEPIDILPENNQVAVSPEQDKHQLPSSTGVAHRQPEVQDNLLPPQEESKEYVAVVNNYTEDTIQNQLQQKDEPKPITSTENFATVQKEAMQKHSTNDETTNKKETLQQPNPLPIAKQQPEKTKNQQLLDSIVESNENTQFAENKQEDAEDGFVIETIPSDEDLVITQVQNDEKPKKKTGILESIFGEDTEDIKKAILPRAFGFDSDREDDIKRPQQDPLPKELPDLKINDNEPKK